MTIEAIDCQGFAGGFTLGMQQAGFSVTSKVENVGGFGAPLVLANAGPGQLLPDLAAYQEGEPTSWRPRRVPVVFGNPPCSGFSGLTGVAMSHNGYSVSTGTDHPINECMWDLVHYAAACKAEILVMESVQLAYTKGRGLMQELRAEMEAETGKRYDLIHVLQNSASVGGSSIRKRYFMVLARRTLNFGMLPPEVPELSTLSEMLYDLENLNTDSWGPVKKIRKPRGRYAKELAGHTTHVDGHVKDTCSDSRAAGWIAANTEWNWGEFVGDPMRRLLKEVPVEKMDDIVKPRVGGLEQRVRNALLSTHPYSPRRWSGDKLPGVLTGTGTRDYVHPTQPRTLTFRECARIMGFPDDWSLAPIGQKLSARRRFLGKGITVHTGTWIGGWAKAALDREPGPWRGDKIGDHEWRINVSNDHKIRYDERTGEMRDSRSKALIKEMEARTW